MNLIIPVPKAAQQAAKAEVTEAAPVGKKKKKVAVYEKQSVVDCEIQLLCETFHARAEHFRQSFASFAKFDELLQKADTLTKPNYDEEFILEPEIKDENLKQRVDTCTELKTQLGIVLAEKVEPKHFIL